MRFVAVTTELVPSKPPCVAAVLKGMLGEAVQVSGTLPPGFAPTVKNGARFTDGGASAIVPSRVVRDYGADVVLSCNSIPGPAQSNPFARSLLGTLLHDCTVVGRVLDVWAWYAFMWERASRTCAPETDVYVEFKPQRFPFLESVSFFRARAIVRSAERERHMLHEKVKALKKLWLELGTPPSSP